LKAQNIYIKPLLKLRNTYNKPCFEAAYLGENVINMLHQKVAQNITISLGYFIFSKNHNESPKVAQLVKICQIMSPCFDFTKKIGPISWKSLKTFFVCSKNVCF
jgi:hypothetical protein